MHVDEPTWGGVPAGELVGGRELNTRARHQRSALRSSPGGPRRGAHGGHAPGVRRCEAEAVGQYTYETKDGPVDVHTRSIDDGWVASVDPAQGSVALPPGDGPVPLPQGGGGGRGLQRAERRSP